MFSSAKWEEKRGFTLVELAITMAVLSVMVLFSLTFLYQAVQTYITVNQRWRGYEEVAFGIESMIREIREASRILHPPAGTTNASRVSVEVKRPSGTETVEFRLSANKLIRNDDQHPLMGHVSSFTVERPSDHDYMLKFSLTFSTDDGQDISTSIHIIPNNLDGSGKFFGQDWWERVKQ